ncbi:putative calcium channel [Podospora fimiseda]|uniref:Calcium channel n=1 Tax=Podospora fimiseda TaxID=252190 RepID=A0AAN7BWR6_9PEZI|nr:putative calcium channel [Podospora fimiseda]
MSDRSTSPGAGSRAGSGPSAPPPPPPLQRQQSHRQTIRILEPPERRPLLPQRRTTAPHNLDPLVFSCYNHNHSNMPGYNTSRHSHLPVYTNIHRIRRDIISVVEDYLSLEQLRDVRINISVIRPLVDKLYEQDDISIVYCLLVNRAYFLSEQKHLSNRLNVNFTRATLCELIATRIMRRFNEDNEGPNNLLVLAHILIAGFEPFQNAPEEIRREVQASTAWHKTLPALEVAILSESRVFLASTSCQKVVDAIYEGRVVYTPSSFMDLIPDHYKQRPISLYNPREAPLLNQYRLLVPRTRNYLEIMQFLFLLILYLFFMAERDPGKFSMLEVCFTTYATGWVLDQFATLLEHGWHVYAQNLWSFLDVTFAVIYWIYLIIRIISWQSGREDLAQQALDVLAMGAPVLVPRLAFNLLSENIVFLSLRSMMSDFALLTALAAWCFIGFLLSLFWLGNGHFTVATISKWMIYIWFGLDGSGIHYSTQFHQLLGPSLMVAFAFLGNTLFLTILVSMLSTTFSTVLVNAPAEIQFRRAVLTLEGVKGDAIFAYQPPFNILAFLFLVPLKFCVSPRWFHKIHVTSVRLLNLPLLLLIAITERRFLQPETVGGVPLAPAPSFAKAYKPPRGPPRFFWEKWKITSHSDISTVFEVPPPDSVLNEIATDDELTKHLIRRQFVARGGGLSDVHSAGATGTTTPEGSGKQQQQDAIGVPPPPGKMLSRRDSIAPFPGLKAEIQGLLSESDEMTDITARLEALEDGQRRIERLLTRLVEGGGAAGGSRGGSVLDGEDD